MNRTRLLAGWLRSLAYALGMIIGVVAGSVFILGAVLAGARGLVWLALVAAVPAAAFTLALAYGSASIDENDYVVSSIAIHSSSSLSQASRNGRRAAITVDGCAGDNPLNSSEPPGRTKRRSWGASSMITGA